MRYGVGYLGSKNRIAKDIVNALPSGKRFIDLFGGGGAISHCAALSDKWNAVVYSDIIPSIVELVDNLFKGNYANNPSLFEWVSRQRFFAELDSNPIIRWCWSFGNNGKHYLYGEKVEAQKEAIHKAIVEAVYSPQFLAITGGEIPFHRSGVSERKKDWLAFCRKRLHSVDANRVPHLERLSCIQSLINLEQIAGSSPVSGIHCMTRSYTDYDYEAGDVVYCDIPYKGTDCKSYRGFNHEAFWAWARRVPCYVSEYNAPQDFECVWEKRLAILADTDGTHGHAMERLYRSPACI